MSKKCYFTSLFLSVIMVFNFFSTFTYAASTADTSKNQRSVDSARIKEFEEQTINYTQNVEFDINEDTKAAKEVVLVLDTSTSLLGDLESPLFDYNILSGGTDDFKVEKSINVAGNIHSNAGFESPGFSFLGGKCSVVKDISISSISYIQKEIKGAPRISMVDFSQKIYDEINKTGSSPRILNASSINKDKSNFTAPTIINGNVTFSGNVKINSKVYINGDVVINASKYSGSGILVATGKITVQGDSFQINKSQEADSLFLYSISSDIVFNTRTLNYKGICYAPNGSIVFDDLTDNLDKNGKTNPHGNILENPVFIGYMAAKSIKVNSNMLTSEIGADKLQKTLKTYIKSSRLEVLKKSACTFIEKFRGKNIKLSIIGFSKNADKEYGNTNKFELFNMSENSNVDALKTDVNNLVTVQGTNIGDGLRRAYYLLTDEGKADLDASKYVVLLTDGEPTNFSYSGSDYKFDDGDTGNNAGYSLSGSTLSALGYAQAMGTKLKEKRITSFIVGFTDGAKGDKLEPIANACASSAVDSEGTNYYRALTSDAIYGVYDSIAIEILGGVEFYAEFTELLPAEVKSATSSNKNITIRKIEQGDVDTWVNSIKIVQDDVGKYLVQGTFDTMVQQSPTNLNIYTTEAEQNFDITVEYKYNAYDVEYPSGKSVISYYAKFTDGSGNPTGENRQLKQHNYNSLNITIDHPIDVN